MLNIMDSLKVKRKRTPSPTLNESLRKSFEQINLYGFESSATVTSDSEATKRLKWNGGIGLSRKSNSAPNSPQHHESNTVRKSKDESFLKKCHSLEFTPPKSATSNVQMGTSERLEILYPQLAARKPITKPKSPQQLRTELKRLTHSAATATGATIATRKRLFPSRCDFVKYFTKKHNLRNVVSHVFAHLNDTDLVSVTRVSRLWKRVACEDANLCRRLGNFRKNEIAEKENCVSGFVDVVKKKSDEDVVKNVSPPGSPATENMKKFIKMGATLSGKQGLTKCPECSSPSIIEPNWFAECTNPRCQYIWCTKCLIGSSFTHLSGVLMCNCRRTPSPKNLSDISNFDQSGLWTNSNSATNANTSSGYFTLSDCDEKSLSTLKHSSSSSSSVLSNCNRNVSSGGLKKPNGSVVRQLYPPVLKRPKRVCRKERDASASPPRGRVVLPAVGSKESKKNLRRLLL